MNKENSHFWEKTKKDKTLARLIKKQKESTKDVRNKRDTTVDIEEIKKRVLLTTLCQQI